MRLLKGVLFLGAISALILAPTYVLGHGNERGTASAKRRGRCGQNRLWPPHAQGA